MVFNPLHIIYATKIIKNGKGLARGQVSTFDISLLSKIIVFIGFIELIANLGIEGFLVD